MLVAEKEEMLGRWREYFESLLNLNLIHAESRSIELGVEEGEDQVDLLTLEEIRMAIRKLKNNKISKIDNIPGEFVKHGGKILLMKLHALFSEI